MIPLVLIFLTMCLDHAENSLSITELIKSYNYPVETHTYQTRDGYILNMHRIPHGLIRNHSDQVVLLVHGLFGRAENFLTLGPPNSLPYYLADKGYDVWLFNSRGSTHSRRHIWLSPLRHASKYWDFSWHEIGIYDLPATIDYILKITGVDRIFYVGHSQGTTVLFVMLSELPEMNRKIKMAANLAPSAFLNYTNSPLMRAVSKIYKIPQQVYSLLGWHEMPVPNTLALLPLLKEFFTPKSTHDLLIDVLYIINGPTSGLIDKKLIPFILAHLPPSSSVRQLWHYLQLIASGEFKQYDYGPEENLIKYNKVKPPNYVLSNCNVPLVFFYAEEDIFSNDQMVEKLRSKVPNVLLSYKIPVPHWGHLDYIYAYNVKTVIYDKLHDMFSCY